MQSVRFHVSKTSSLYIWNKPFGRNKRFVTCKSPGYQAIHLNPTTQCKIISKINPLVFSLLGGEREVPPPLLAKILPVDSPPPKVHRPHWITTFKLKTNKNFIFCCSHWSCTVFYFNFVLFLHAGHQVMLTLILFDVKYLQNIVFYLCEGRKGRNHSSSDTNHSIKNSPQQNLSFPPLGRDILHIPLNAIWKTLLGTSSKVSFRIFSSILNCKYSNQGIKK